MSKVVPVHTIKAYAGSRGVAPLIRNFGTRWRWVASITSGRSDAGKNVDTL
jgi:hypothetical protein